MTVSVPVASEPASVSAAADYRALADFRYHVRRFFAFSEETTKAAGVAPAQYQAMLAIRAHDTTGPMSISVLAERLFIKLNSAVELVQRLETAGMVERTRSKRDNRRVELTLTALGGLMVERLAALHLDEHRRGLTELARIVSELGVF